MTVYISIFCFVLYIEKKKTCMSPSIFLNSFTISSVHLLSRVRPHELQHARLPYSTLMFVESVMPSSHLILCRPLLFLPPPPPSIRVFSSESTLCMRWPKYWSFSFNISPPSEYPGLISFRMDWLDLLAVHGTLKSLLQHHNSKASILRCSAFFTVQLSHPHMTTGETIALTRRTVVGKVMSLLFNMLSSTIAVSLLLSWTISLCLKY